MKRINLIVAAFSADMLNKSVIFDNLFGSGLSRGIDRRHQSAFFFLLQSAISKDNLIKNMFEFFR